MKLKKINRIKKLERELAEKIGKEYENKGYLIEITKSEDNTVLNQRDKYELNVYELIKRTKRWFA